LNADSAKERIRPDARKKSGRAGDKEPSAKARDSDVPWTGGGVCPAKKIVRSHVANGAVNGISAREMSQAAISLPIIGVPDGWQDRGQKGRFSGMYKARLFR